MTDEMVRGSILLGIEDAGEGVTPEQLAESILLSLKTALRLEARMAKSHAEPEAPAAAPASKPKTSIPTPPMSSGDSMVVLASQASLPKTAPNERLIVMPGDPEEKVPPPVLPQDSVNKVPIRLSSLKKPARAKDPWIIEDLVAHLHANTPEEISVIPHGLKTEIVLERNILTAAPMGCCKLVFTLHGMSPDRPGAMGLPDDKRVIAAVIGRFVSKNFFVSDSLDLKIPQAIEELKASARDVFQRRDRELQSHTPYKPGGHLRIDVDDRGRVSDPSIPGALFEMDLSIKE